LCLDLPARIGVVRRRTSCGSAEESVAIAFELAVNFGSNEAAAHDGDHRCPPYRYRRRCAACSWRR